MGVRPPREGVRLHQEKGCRQWVFLSGGDCCPPEAKTLTYLCSRHGEKRDRARPRGRKRDGQENAVTVHAR